MIVTRYQVSNSEINTNPVPTPANTSPTFEFVATPAEALPGRAVDDGDSQAVAGAAGHDVEGVAAVPGTDDTAAAPPTDEGVDRVENGGDSSNPGALELSGGAAATSGNDPAGVCGATGVVSPGRLTGTLRGRTKAPHVRQNPTSGGSGAPHCQQLIIGVLSVGSPSQPG